MTSVTVIQASVWFDFFLGCSGGGGGASKSHSIIFSTAISPFSGSEKAGTITEGERKEGNRITASGDEQSVSAEVFFPAYQSE